MPQFLIRDQGRGFVIVLSRFVVRPFDQLTAPSAIEGQAHHPTRLSSSQAEHDRKVCTWIACLRQVKRLPVRCTQTGGRQVRSRRMLMADVLRGLNCVLADTGVYHASLSVANEGHKNSAAPAAQFNHGMQRIANRAGSRGCRSLAA
jgi:hypothetical protein